MRTNVSVLEPVTTKPASFLSKISMLSAALLLTGFSAQARAQDYSIFNSVLQQQGTPSEDGTQITYALVRQDLSGLTVKLNGSPATSAAPESVANGFIGIQQLAAVTSTIGTYFVDGSFPAEAKQLPVLETALAIAGFPITAITDDTAGLSKTVYHVHIEGTISSNPTVLATALATALATVNNPQLNVGIVYPGVVFSGVPKKFQRLVTNGVYRLIDNNAVVFSIGRNDAKEIKLGMVPGTQSIGVAETIVITGDGTSSVVNVELALKKGEVTNVQNILLAAGYTLSAQGDYFTDDSPRLTYLHAVATAQNQDKLYEQLEPLGEALLKIVKK